MTSGYKNSSQVDLDNIFSTRVATDPSANATGYVTSDGLDLASRYYPLQAGITPGAATGFKTIVSGASTDLCNVFATTQVWNTVGTGVVTGTAIYSICAVDASNIYVAGIFTNIGGVAATNVAKWNGTAWSSLGFSTSYVNNRPSVSITAIPGSNVFVSYQLTDAVTGHVNVCISMYNFSSWTNLIGVNEALEWGLSSRYVNDLVLLDTNTLFVCARTFSKTFGLVKYNISTATWTQLGIGLLTALGLSEWSVLRPNAMAKISSTQIIVGGSLPSCIAVFDNTTSTWTQFIASYSFGEIYSISVVSPTVVFVGTITGLHRINDAGTGWVNTNASSTLSRPDVTSVYAVNSTNVYFAGFFNNPPYVTVAKWNGSSLVSIANGIPDFGEHTVNSIAGTGIRNVYFGGIFTSVNNVSGGVSVPLTASRIAKWA